MTQEEKDLLLKDLCARLPYKVKVYDIKNSANSSYFMLNHVNKLGEVFISYKYICRTAPIEDIKPYLFPLSSMSEEQRREWQSLMIRDSYGILYPTIDSLDYLYKNHIDIRGLIPKGLANDATGLNIYLDMSYSLKASYTHFLESHGFTNFYGVDSAIRGSKIISVFIKKEYKQEFEKLNGGTDGYRRYWITPVWESENSIEYSVSCRKV